MAMQIQPTVTNSTPGVVGHVQPGSVQRSAPDILASPAALTATKLGDPVDLTANLPRPGFYIGTGEEGTYEPPAAPVVDNRSPEERMADAAERTAAAAERAATAEEAAARAANRHWWS